MTGHKERRTSWLPRSTGSAEWLESTSGSRSTGAKAMRTLLIGMTLAAAIAALAMTDAWAKAKRPKSPKPFPPIATRPHVEICHPDVCFITQQAHDQYACDHACQWDDPLDADNDTVIDFELKFLERSDIENDVPYMYLDSVGNVTVGIGHLISNKAAAEALPFYNAKTGKKATKAEIDTAFDAVQNAPTPHAAGFYQSYSDLVLHQPDITSLAQKQLNEATADLKTMFPDYENFPAKARAALLDMMYNLGAYRLRVRFPHFDAAVRAYAWDIAAVQSQRNVQKARNDAIKGWLQDATSWETEAFARQALCGVQPPDLPPTSGPVSSGPVVAPAARPVSSGLPSSGNPRH